MSDMASRISTIKGIFFGSVKETFCIVLMYIASIKSFHGRNISLRRVRMTFDVMVGETLMS